MYYYIHCSSATRTSARMLDNKVRICGMILSSLSISLLGRLRCPLDGGRYAATCGDSCYFITPFSATSFRFCRKREQRCFLISGHEQLVVDSNPGDGQILKTRPILQLIGPCRSGSTAYPCYNRTLYEMSQSFRSSTLRRLKHIPATPTDY